MPVFDGEAYLREAMDSILAQTLPELELLVIDDGSRDSSAEIAASYRDPRVRVVRHAANQGLIRTLNEGLASVRTEYVARMDADDVAHPRRIAAQVRYMDAHPDVAALGTGVRNFGETRRSWTLERDHAAVRARLLFECALNHPSVMLRPELLRRHGLRYDSSYPHAEDWALWVALAERAAVANLPRCLVRYRTHPGQVTTVFNRAQADSIRKIFRAQLAGLGIDASERDLDLHALAASGVFAPSAALLDDVEAWLRRIAAAAPAWPPPFDRALAIEVSYRWARVCRRSRALGLLALRRFHASPLHRDAPWRTKAQLALGALARALVDGGRA
jgi:glycosyltransferase involved in cell wall biosynthesis